MPFTITPFEFLFEFNHFYDHQYEDGLPGTVDEVIVHFHKFLDLYIPLGKYLDNEYSASNDNMWIALGHNIGEVKEVELNREEYEQLCKYHQKLRLYYTHLLNACRRMYNVWLNDHMPEQYKEPVKKSKHKKSQNIK